MENFFKLNRPVDGTQQGDGDNEMNAKIIRLPAPRRKPSSSEMEVLEQLRELRTEMILLRKLIAKAIPPSPFDYEGESRV